jgi:hypothetical protein
MRLWRRARSNCPGIYRELSYSNADHEVKLGRSVHPNDGQQTPTNRSNTLILPIFYEVPVVVKPDVFGV